LDGDGRADLLAGIHRLRVWRGRGDGTFDRPIDQHGLPYRRSYLLIVDGDGDGHLDLWTVGWEFLAVQRGRGDGTFVGPSATVEVGAESGAFAAGDVDRDGHPDLV